MNVPLLNMCQRAHLKPAETRCVEIVIFKDLNEYFIAGVDLGLKGHWYSHGIGVGVPQKNLQIEAVGNNPDTVVSHRMV